MPRQAEIQNPNSDPILHQHACHAKNKQGIQSGSGRQRASYEKALRQAGSPGAGEVRCASWMFAYIGVVSHPFFAVTDEEGTFRFPPGLPEGKYRVAASIPKARRIGSEITVAANEPRVLNFNLAVPESAVGF